MTLRITYLITALLLAGNIYAEDDSEKCVLAKSAIEAASEIRGLKIKKEVPCYVHSREQVEEFLMDTLENKITFEKLRKEEKILKALGFLPEDFGYVDGLVELYSSQVGGYYDPSKNHFVMAGWMPLILQTTIAVHELTHALQDQYFDLGEFIEDDSLSSDELMAHSALAEGDASAVMYDYTRAIAGQPGIAEDEDVQGAMMQNVISAAMMIGTTNTPETLQNMLVFPYTSGLRFAHVLLKKGGYKRIDKAFKRPPSSTEEILHPEKYLAATKDYIEINEQELRIDGVPLGAKKTHSDVMGEFSIAALLGSYLKDKGEAADAAAGWGGDKVAVFTSNEKDVVVWKTAWDTEKDSVEFIATYLKVLRKRFPKDNLDLTGGKWSTLKDGKKIQLSRKKSTVTFIIAL